MPYYSNDPLWLTVKYADNCSKCGAVIAAGTEAFHYPLNRTTLCAGDCGKDAANDFAAAKFDEDGY